MSCDNIEGMSTRQPLGQQIHLCWLFICPRVKYRFNAVANGNKTAFATVNVCLCVYNQSEGEYRERERDRQIMSDGKGIRNREEVRGTDSLLCPLAG